jgi:hypothetical protein
MEPAKVRSLSLPIHVCAYLGEYMKMYEAGVKRIAYENVKKAKEKASNTHLHEEQSRADR